MKNKLNVIGIMSGTSLDGLDIAHCEFTQTQGKWSFNILQAATIPYSAPISRRLKEAANLSSEEIIALDVFYGNHVGKVCTDFLKKHSIKVDFISSHGHTIFHQPAKGFTYQIGNGNAIHAVTGLPVIYDFRSLDVILGGEGAPLVPVGDKFLFSDYDVCLNLGGIANLSMDKNTKRIAFDICFCNMSLNYLMQQKGKAFDRGGQLASGGEVDKKLLRKLSSVYTPLKKSRPSIGRELFEKKVQPLLDVADISIEDKLATCIESTAMEISEIVKGSKKKNMLCTGGGAYNSYMMSRILHHCEDEISIIVPEDDIIKFKEAMVFAFLGVLRFNKEINCLSSVTGALRDSSSGIMVGF